MSGRNSITVRQVMPSPTRARFVGLTVGILLLSAPATTSATSRSIGSPHGGYLVDGFELPLEGHHHRFFDAIEGRQTNYATLQLAALIGRAARVVATAMPGGARLVLGDCSVEGGGHVKRHKSHRSGRDVDILFYRVDGSGRSLPADGFMRFDGRGQCRGRRCKTRLDVPRTWWLLRTLLVSQLPAVQYAFVSRPIRRLLLAYAQSRGEHAEVLRRAEKVIRQPRGAAPHDDHIHLRTYCTASDLQAGCKNSGPRWPWVSEIGEAQPL
ncbi:MAG: penicillin-insensitive murein endopeptidase [Myxococcota bacterium]|jgi:penicillin-insensitive murein endopeptidase|nr:penicillin-insensitive murein endopeptidase [Myxococcota bacterium]